MQANQLITEPSYIVLASTAVSISVVHDMAAYLEDRKNISGLENDSEFL